MPNTRKDVEREAIAWLIRLRDPSAEDWEEFTLWLETDPDNNRVYSELTLADEDLESLTKTKARPIPLYETQTNRGRPERRTFLRWGAAAALVATLGYAWVQPRDTSYAVQTGPGERRTVELADGSRIDLNGSTSIILHREEARFARVETGEALFTVVHDASRPFNVEAGDAVIRDVGTKFNVIYGAGAIEVAVAEGAVIFNPERQAVSLSPGMVLRQEGRELTVARGEAGAIGGWQGGRLSYSFAPISQVAADLSRNLGVPVEARASVATRRFSGVIVLDNDQQRLFRRVSSLLDVRAQRLGPGWVLSSGDR